MGLTLASIRRPVFISMFVLVLVILGIRSRQAMPKEQMPDTDAPYITISTTYAGAGPEEIETLVSKPIEDAVASINGLKHVTSTSREGISVVSMELYFGTDLDAAAADVRDKVSSVRGELPSEASDPAVSKLNISSEPVIKVGISGTLDPRELRRLTDSTIKDDFAKTPGAAAVYIQGGEQREIQVNVNKARLQAYGMSISQVAAAINARNRNQPGGSIKETTQEYSVRTVGEFTSPDEIRNVRLAVSSASGRGSSTVMLKDVATVQDTVAEPDTITRLGIGSGSPTPAVIVSVQKQSGSNTLDVANGIKSEMARLLGKVFDESAGAIRDYDPARDRGAPPERVLPAGLNMVVASDQSIRVRDSLNDVNKSLVEGILLVVAIVFLFLHSGRATFIVALAIPTSMFATFLPIHAMGHTLNTMTLLALSLAVGILVDDSIVVLENIERHLRKGEPPEEAAANGRSEIGLAAIAITMVDVAVFLPIATMGGMMGQFFRPFGWTVAIATLFSLFMSFTLTPMLASRFFETGHGSTKETAAGFWAGVFRGFDRFYASLDNLYEGILAWTLENRALTIAIGWATLFTVVAMMLSAQSKPLFAVIITVIMAIGLALSRDRKAGVFIGIVMIGTLFVTRLPLGFEFFPTADQGEFSVSVETRAGQALGVTNATVGQVGDIVRSLKDPKTGKPIVQYTILTTGASSASSAMGGGDSGSQYGVVSAKLVGKSERSESLDDVIRRVTELTATIPGAKLEARSSGGIGGGKPITEEITGPDLAQNVKVADQLMGRMLAIPGIVNADTSWKTGSPEVKIKVDDARAADRGLTSSAIANAAYLAFEGSGGGSADTKYRESGDQYTIRVQYSKRNRNNVGEARNLIVASANGRPVYLKDVAQVTLGSAPNQIERKDRQRLIKVDASVAQGYSQGNLQSAVSEAASTVATGSSRIGMGGTGAIQQEAMGYIVSALALAVVLVYMLMAALFESLTTPFVIWLSLPQALVGGLLGLMVANKTFSIVAMIGIIMLMGLVTKNAILLIDYTNTLRSRGKTRREAILEAGPTRLRPVMMTTLAMVGGMLPTALAISEGSEQRQPMAIVVIGGLILSTMLTLLVIPVTYTLMDDVVSGAHNRWLSLMGRRGRKPAAVEVEASSLPGK
ncbi:MAG TPA: efflux RND transporter permease subunit [Armatimonadota bacterium]|jgi:HAE1 family hydrophobic/amphiphilic exporter-1